MQTTSSDAAALVRRYQESLVAGDPVSAWKMLAPEQRAVWTLDAFSRASANLVGLAPCLYAIRPQPRDASLIARWADDATAFPAHTAELPDATLVEVDFATASAQDNSAWEMFLVGPDASGITYLWSLR